ncbi:MAG TPA: hypothetical protein VKU94_02130 [Geobacterales bacterium]|nr:hypothetical protein [Geobacterales bacterium]
MTENEKLSRLVVEALLLLEAIPKFYGINLTEENVESVLYLVYGLNEKQAITLIETSRGKVFEDSAYVVKKARKELYKFLSCMGKIVVVEAFFETGAYEFRTT